jgi:hypothetical protein
LSGCGAGGYDQQKQNRKIPMHTNLQLEQSN